MPHLSVLFRVTPVDLTNRTLTSRTQWHPRNIRRQDWDVLVWKRVHNPYPSYIHGFTRAATIRLVGNISRRGFSPISGGMMFVLEKPKLAMEEARLYWDSVRVFARKFVRARADGRLDLIRVGIMNPTGGIAIVIRNSDNFGFPEGFFDDAANLTSLVTVGVSISHTITQYGDHSFLCHLRKMVRILPGPYSADTITYRRKSRHPNLHAELPHLPKYPYIVHVRGRNTLSSRYPMLLSDLFFPSCGDLGNSNFANNVEWELDADEPELGDIASSGIEHIPEGRLLTITRPKLNLDDASAYWDNVAWTATRLVHDRVKDTANTVAVGLYRKSLAGIRVLVPMAPDDPIQRTFDAIDLLMAHLEDEDGSHSFIAVMTKCRKVLSAPYSSEAREFNLMNTDQQISYALGKKPMSTVICSIAPLLHSM
ncbi:hypothetical protein BV25DRAFT_1836670 [Artomyces pyxidatus]|uniref:Uncharacterized protein n=1 Tax=Artomyces pyxidatus TaxID=48021 RepID=A0ACB8T7Q1_9AGAM|nr:hypothetical protein BV25DRAFT_1836670 [Artomyces pyxidatus]